MGIPRLGPDRHVQIGAVIAAVLITIGLPVRARADEPVVKPFVVIDHALERWRARPGPRHLSYVVAFTGHNKDRVFRRTFRVEASVPDHQTHVTVLVSEGTAPPFVQPEKPRFLATETFGFIPAQALLPEVTPAAPAAGIPIIAAVHASVRYPYDVRFLGIEAVDSRAAYHLELDPRQDRAAYPLRELWIDVATYDVLQVVAQEFEHIGPISVPYLVNARYAEQGPYWLIAHAKAGATIHAGLFSIATTADADFGDFQIAP